MNCEQKLRKGGICPEPAVYRFTWPGQDEAGICESHAADARGVARAMGLHLQLIPLDGGETEDG